MSKVRTENGEAIFVYYGRWQEQEETHDKSFRVADTELGIMAVAKALNFGWSDIRATDHEAEKYAKHGISFRKCGRKAHYKQPVVIIADETIGYRDISRSFVESAFQDVVITYDDWDEEEQRGNIWTVDIYRLHTGMPDGWITVQSSSSRATITAEKCGSSWNITLSMPILESGGYAGHSYEARFASAEAWYKERLKN